MTGVISIPNPLPDARQEAFCKFYFDGQMSGQEAAIEAGYKPRSAVVAASRLISQDKIKGRIQFLKDRSANAKIATVIECKETLTQQVRARVSDFLTCSADGVWFYDIGPETINTAAIKKIKTATIPVKGGGDGDTKIIITELELHDPRGAIAELNKMQGSYAPIKTEVTGKDGGPIEFADAKQKLATRLNALAATREAERIVSGVDRQGSGPTSV
jgi:phage terminase small subunit